MPKESVLTGITTTGKPHLGNDIGAIRLSTVASQDKSVIGFYSPFFFIPRSLQTVTI